MTSRRARRQDGFALVLVLMLVMMVVLTSGMVIMPSLMGRQAAIRSGSAMQAANVSEAGIDFALAALNSTIPSGNTFGLGTLPASFVRGTGGGSNTWTYSDGSNAAFFRQTFGVSPQLTIRVPTVVPIPGGAGVAGEYRIVRAQTNWEGAQKTIEAIVRMRTQAVEVPGNPFPRAITARGDVTANGTDGAPRTDSYDSTTGPYGGLNLGTRGGVHTNGSIVDGGLYKGSVSAVGGVDAGVSVTGTGNTVQAGVTDEYIPDPPVAPATTTAVAVNPPQTISPTAGEVVGLGDISLSGNAGNVLTLNAGAYVIDSLRTTGNASILIGTGPVTLYVRGNVGIQGNGLINASALPTNLRLIVTNPAATVDLSGNGHFYGAVQAPNNAVTLGGNGEFFGAVVANTFRFNGSNSVVHYDDQVGRTFWTNFLTPRPAQFQALAINILNRGQ